MYAVIRHTLEIVKPEADNPTSLKSYGQWKHYSWIFDTYEDALESAISMLDHPLLKGNLYYQNHAISKLKQDNYWQTGRESVAIAEVVNKNLYERNKKNEKFIH
tara:strand:- start:805 stop:1116 length:312 start_codon:yes stop_codon:yes gene_type:complete